METITNDKQFRALLDSLGIEQQRLLAYNIVKNVIHLCTDKRIDKALSSVEDKQSTAEDRDNIYKQIKIISTGSYTDCGSEVDWKQQAEHFVISAMVASLTPEHLIEQGKNLVWKTAMQARMANNCEMIEKESAEIVNEAAKQYKLAEAFL